MGMSDVGFWMLDVGCRIYANVLSLQISKKSKEKIRKVDSGNNVNLNIVQVSIAKPLTFCIPQHWREV
jgi:hypothetical protein